jgi:hypothetical protein
VSFIFIGSHVFAEISDQVAQRYAESNPKTATRTDSHRKATGAQLTSTVHAVDDVVLIS